MKNLKYTFIILVIFLKTGNVLSEINLFNVNNIEIINNSSTNNETLANRAIKKGYRELVKRILLNDDLEKVGNLDFASIKSLVSYYQVINEEENFGKLTTVFNVSFDKNKMHDLFYQKGISYSDIIKNEFYLLPIFKKDSQIYIYSQNYFYQKWNEIDKNELVEFILPIENIETIQKINLNKNNLLDIDIRNLFQEYSNKNLALVFIEDSNSTEEKIFIKTNILGKKINKQIVVKKLNLSDEKFYKKIIIEVRNEIINLAKSQNLIDVRTPSFINTRFELDKNNNLVELNNRINKIDLIESIYVQELNNEYVLLKIKYLGKINKIIEQLKNQKIILRLSGENWSLKII